MIDKELVEMIEKSNKIDISEYIPFEETLNKLERICEMRKKISNMIVDYTSVGFTGTREGMTKLQAIVVHSILCKYADKLTVHHGDCVGADEQFHDICGIMGVSNIIIHPPEYSKYRAFCKSKYIRESKEFLERNKDIVDESDFLIAVPKENEEVKRSGTWATIRYAMKNKKTVVIIFPDGEISINN